MGKRGQQWSKLRLCSRPILELPHGLKLTDTDIGAAKPKEKRYKLADGEGLHIESAAPGASGGTSRPLCGKEKRVSLGVYTAIDLKEARSRAGEIKGPLRRGIDPGRRTEGRQGGSGGGGDCEGPDL